MIACDPSATSSAGTNFNQIADLIQQQVSVVNNNINTVTADGRGQWVTAFLEDAEALITLLNDLSSRAGGIGSDLIATAQAFENGDMTSVGYFNT